MAPMEPRTESAKKPPTFFTATLVANDFLRQTVSFDDGLPGHVVPNREVLNRDSDIDFGGYFPNRLTVGIQGGERATIIDCGHWRDLKQEYGCNETVRGGQGFVSIRFIDDELVIKGVGGGTQPFTKGIEFLETTPTDTTVPIRPRIGHIYLVNTIDVHDSDFQHIVKFMVTSGIKDQEVTIIWENLRILP
jgi:hypothetical protein